MIWENQFYQNMYHSDVLLCCCRRRDQFISTYQTIEKMFYCAIWWVMKTAKLDQGQDQLLWQKKRKVQHFCWWRKVRSGRIWIILTFRWLKSSQHPARQLWDSHWHGLHSQTAILCFKWIIQPEPISHCSSVRRVTQKWQLPFLCLLELRRLIRAHKWWCAYKK